MSAAERHNVTVSGPPDGPAMVFAHGFGCDQNMWRLRRAGVRGPTSGSCCSTTSGAGGSDAAAYDRERYGSLHGYADDVLEICRELDLTDVVFVGHSVSAMIGVLAAPRSPSGSRGWCWSARRRATSTTTATSAASAEADIDELLESLDSNYLGWSSAMAPVIMGNPDRPELGEELTEQLLPHRPGHRPPLRRASRSCPTTAPTCRGSRRPTLVLQCSRRRHRARAVGRVRRTGRSRQPSSCCSTRPATART